MTMTTSHPGTGIYLVTVTTAEGRTVECAGDEDYVDGWLHKMAEAELAVYGPIWDSPGTSPEEDF